MRVKLPRRRLVDWMPQDGDQGEWLERLAVEGWVPEHRTGAEVVVNGRKVVRFALVERASGMTKEPPPG
ncbi:MAG: hypothetical protein HOW59_37090 [Nonomuraea sp.]|nr:hypothetical protein [Nonomuraea sp.]NUQ33270.1 hypothetical protein [Dermatophilaceae bacterium]NUR81088.1 hypothetical protein [Dermatophilaceae bacterium]